MDLFRVSFIIFVGFCIAQIVQIFYTPLIVSYRDLITKCVDCPLFSYIFSDCRIINTVATVCAAALLLCICLTCFALSAIYFFTLFYNSINNLSLTPFYSNTIRFHSVSWWLRIQSTVLRVQLDTFQFGYTFFRFSRYTNQLILLFLARLFFCRRRSLYLHT